MNFAEPGFLRLLLLVPVAIGLIWYGLVRRRRRLAKLAQRETLGNLVPKDSRARLFGKALLLTLGLAFIAVAAARPRFGFEWKDVKRRGVEIVIALDVSRSMLAEDLSPNRLQRAKREIIDLLRMLRGDRIGLVAFAGVAFVQCPLTVDYSAVEMFLDSMTDDLIPVQGTSLGDAINVGVKSLTEAASEETLGKAIILITDGEDQGSEPVAAAENAKKAGVKIFTIGVGAEGGAPIPEAGGGFKKDARGNVVLSRLDEGSLQKIAAITGGTYVRSVTGDFDLERIYAEGIRGGDLQVGDIHASREKLWRERYQWFAFAAFIALFWEFFIWPFKRDD